MSSVPVLEDGTPVWFCRDHMTMQPRGVGCAMCRVDAALPMRTTAARTWEQIAEDVAEQREPGSGPDEGGTS